MEKEMALIQSETSAKLTYLQATTVEITKYE